MNGLVEIEDLDVELGDTLLNRVGDLCDIQISLLLSNLVEFQLIAVLVAIPYGPRGVDAIGTIIIGLIDFSINGTIGNSSCTCL